MIDRGDREGLHSNCVKRGDERVCVSLSKFVPSPVCLSTANSPGTSGSRGIFTASENMPARTIKQTHTHIYIHTTLNTERGTSDCRRDSYTKCVFVVQPNFQFHLISKININGSLLLRDTPAGWAEVEGMNSNRCARAGTEGIFKLTRDNSKRLRNEMRVLFGLSVLCAINSNCFDYNLCAVDHCGGLSKSVHSIIIYHSARDNLMPPHGTNNHNTHKHSGRIHSDCINRYAFSNIRLPKNRTHARARARTLTRANTHAGARAHACTNTSAESFNNFHRPQAAAYHEIFICLRCVVAPLISAHARASGRIL